MDLFAENVPDIIINRSPVPESVGVHANEQTTNVQVISIP